ncbi:MAG: hypothetical protein UY07_C0024G0024 [Parcubacteria group bacterium GW2011_GWA1_47_8]|nr:MAG: hypothetical protein UY07_C0024G0024 [Parcubacteria group bacterium GW2011_GWA1_47_8]KKW07134.1 MAG: hypothetical protein UY42_C0018G0026 [Parcubacteria group bacterium GW2011_GWA2_49_16]
MGIKNPINTVGAWVVRKGLEKGILEKNYDEKFPSLSKEWCEAIKRLADLKINERFLTGGRQIYWFNKYRIHPLRIFGETK